MRNEELGMAARPPDVLSDAEECGSKFLIPNS